MLHFVLDTQFDQTENCDHVAKILNYLNCNSVISLTDLKELLENIVKNEQKNKVPQSNIQAPVHPVAKPQPVIQHHPIQHESTNANLMNNVKSCTPTQNQANSASESVPVQQNEPTEKPMTMFYLLQHYSKANAAKYKAQKAQKTKKNVEPENGSKTKKQNNPAPKQVDAGFAIPGQQSTTAQKFDQPAVKVEQQPIIPQTSVNPVQQQTVNQPSSPINFGETTVLGGGQIGETTVLNTSENAARVDPYLIRAKNNEKIPINKQVFRIGKERSYVDYFIGDNTAISRSHANVINHDGEFYILDTNSTNHTYLNGVMLQSNVETKLNHGAKIRLANEDFEFRMY